tara:strand:+ start:1280 stop:2434 length:1155 start_codon:yes stop_codon:yes gene_type:complete
LSTTPDSFTADKLFSDLSGKVDFHLLDVRNEDDFDCFRVEGPFPIQMSNIPYFDFMEEQDTSVSKVPKNMPIKIVCAKEGSAQYVAEILASQGFSDVSFLSGGIKLWGELLTPVRVNSKNDKYDLYQFIRPGKGCLSYGVIYGGEMAIIDPSRNLHFYRNFAETHGAVIAEVIETHSHADHLSGGLELCFSQETEMMAHENDFPDSPFNYRRLEDGETKTLCKDGPEMTLFHTPGHTEGSITCLIDGRYLITGDTLFIISAGRPDLGGKAEKWVYDLYETLLDKYTQYPGDAEVLPAHYVTWKEADESGKFAAPLKRLWNENPIFSLSSENEFVQFIIDNMRESPEVYIDIKKVNRGLVQVTEQEADIMDLGKNECAASHYDSD